jgi:hypothetical protein
VTPFNLYRAKLFEGIGNASNPQFQKHYWEKREEDYVAMNEKIEEHLRSSSEFK